MKRMLNIMLIIVLAVVMCISMSGCGSGSGDNSGDAASTSLGKPDVDLSQIDWTIESGIVDGYRTVVFGYTNNMEYEVVDFGLDFKVKDGVTNDQLEAYSELKEKASDMDHDIGEITFEAMTSKCVPPGESVDGCACTLDGTIEYYSDFDSYELFEPDMMTVVIESYGKLYAVYYDYASDKTTMDDDVIDAYTWPDSEIGKAVPKPEVKYVTISFDDEDGFTADAYGASKDDFNTYVETCKNSGFNKDVDSSSDSFSAVNEEGIEIDIYYYSSEDEIYISVDK